MEGPSFSRRALRWAAVFGVLLAIGYFVPGCVLDKFLFHPRAEAELRAPGVEPVRYAAADGSTIVSYFVHARGEPRATVVYFHGNAGTAASNVFFAQDLARQHIDVFLAEYRGYGASQGQVSAEGVLEDGEAAMREIARRGVPADRVVVHGQSLGGAVAVHALARHAVGAGILESTFTSLHDVARNMFGVPLSYIARDAWAFRSEEDVAAQSAPLLVVHGESDELIPIALGRRLFALARSPKRFVAVPGAGHNLPYEARVDAVSAFMNERFPPR